MQELQTALKHSCAQLLLNTLYADICQTHFSASQLIGAPIREMHEFTSQATRENCDKAKQDTRPKLFVLFCFYFCYLFDTLRFSYYGPCYADICQTHVSATRLIGAPFIPTVREQGLVGKMVA